MDRFLQLFERHPWLALAAILCWHVSEAVTDEIVRPVLAEFTKFLIGSS